MNTLKSFFGKVLIYLFYIRVTYMFIRSKKFVTTWGRGTYGEPAILCFDGISRLSVGAYVSFASEVSILLGTNHKKGTVTTYPRSRLDNTITQTQTNDPGNVVIGNDVWIGYGVTIIGPVTIGNGAIIGAGAVVVSDIPPFAVAVGVPAKVVKYRFDHETISALERIAWWNWEEGAIKKSQNLLYSVDEAKSFVEAFDKKD